MKFILKLFKWSLILGFILALVGFLAGTIYSAGVIKQTPKITEEMIEEVKEKMQELINADLKIRKVVMTHDEAVRFYQEEPDKNQPHFDVFRYSSKSAVLFSIILISQSPNLNQIDNLQGVRDEVFQAVE